MKATQNITVVGPDLPIRKQIGFVIRERIGMAVYNPYAVGVIGLWDIAIIIQMKTETELNEGTKMQAVDLQRERMQPVCYVCG